ncbi:MAG TPA: SMI1/KNR4 family protein [Bacillota bacterium]|jgi:HEAT repeat protein|nr:SMI1/KNR4 family protein [Bacillota bacterium]
MREQIDRIREKLIKAKAKDDQLQTFGSNKHRYELNPPLSREAIAAFEAKNGITLPEEYQLFLTELGNGGAGPYYGIYQLKIDVYDPYLAKHCRLHPNLSDEEWAELIKFSEQDDWDDEEYNALFQGMLEIGTQGCTYCMMLVISGENRGRIVYCDMDLQKPFFTYEANFLDWYERWLDEIINGYEMSWFGYKMGGDDTKLLEVFRSSNDEKQQLVALDGMYRLPSLLDDTIIFLEEQCQTGSVNIKSAALGLLTKHSFIKVKPFLLELLADEEESVRLIALKYIYWYGNIDEVAGVVKALLPKTNSDENFRFITYILEKSAIDDVAIYIPFFYHSDREIRRSAIYAVGKSVKKVQYLKDFINCLQDDDPGVIHAAVQALKGVVNPSLLPYYYQLLEKYPNGEHYIKSNVQSRLAEFKQRY